MINGYNYVINIIKVYLKGTEQPLFRYIYWNTIP